MNNILKLLLLLPVLAWSQTDTLNYVRTYTYKAPTNTSDATKANAAVTYFDGLGRPIQQIAGNMSGTGKDMVTHIEYDKFGRQPKDYLPYEAATTNLSYVGTAGTDVVTFYNKAVFENTANPYSEKFFEASPLNRVLKQGAPGTPWKGNTADDNDHTVKFAYLANTDADAVGRYKVTTQWNEANKMYNTAIILDGNYAAGQLYKTYTQDENRASAISTFSGNKTNVTEEYKDKQGRVILKRAYYNSSDDFGMPQASGTSTYYVYDEFGNLAYVLPLSTFQELTEDVLNKYCYQYKYDARNRLIEKKLPGKDWEYIVYDTQDRPVASGPVYSPFGSPLYTDKGWLITKYDDFGRVAYTGWYAATAFSSSARSTMQTQAFSTVSKSGTAVTIDNIQLNYTNVGFPTTNMRLLTVNYYDNYTFTGAAAVPANVETQTLATSVKGLPTGTWNRVLTTNAQSYAEITTTFYDVKGRPIRVRAANTMYGGYTQTDTKLDFDGRALYTVTRHKRTASSAETELKVQNDFSYTAQDRLLSETHTINSGTAQQMAYNTYNTIGQLTSKNVGRTQSAPLQKVDFKYNIRGWLTQINNVNGLGNSSPLATTPIDLFAYKINYTQTEGEGGIQPLYNGNIAETSWKTASDNIMRRYGYVYDNLNRLRDAYYQIPNASDTPLRQSYNEHIKYDDRGNITRLRRNGGVDAAAPVVEIDNLKYYYTGNRLDRVEDTSNSPQGFKDITAGATNDFTYDALGNLTSDLSKGIQANGIVYNHLNLPVTITMSGTTPGTISYIYTAAGTKVQKKVTNNSTTPATITTTDYISGFQYTNSALDFFPTSEGYVKNTVVSGVNNYNYVYQYKDHLGNVRLSYTLDPADNKVKIMDENHYYPFGMKHQGYSAQQLSFESINIINAITLVPVINPGDATYKYKYQGQERQDELGLNWDNFKWRNYDCAIGRFFNIDPLAEKYAYQSPYNFSENKVIAFRELEGLEAIPSTHASDLANQRLGQQGLNNPYKPGTTVSNYCTQTQQTYARVYTEGVTNPQGRWLLDPADVKGLSPSEIQAKFALPNEPTHIGEVIVPEGTKITVGEVGENFGFTPEGTLQIELREEIPTENFTNFRMLEPPPIMEPVPLVPLVEPTPTVIEPMPIIEPPIIEPIFIP